MPPVLRAKKMSVEDHAKCLTAAMQLLQNVANASAKAGLDVQLHIYDHCGPAKRGQKFKVTGRVSVDIGSQLNSSH
jgi:hypothetical protein